jgi:hypothetical protein
MATIDLRGATVSAADPPIGTNPNPDLAIKAPVRVATTGGNINLQTFGLGTIDGVALAAGDRVLVKDQTDATTNGIYNASTGPWTRAIDAANNSQWTTGTQVSVTAGTTNAGKTYQLTTAIPIVIGTSLMTFAIVSVSGNFVGDSGSGGAAGAVPAPPAGSGAIDAVLKASGAFGVVGLTNVRLAKSGAYAALNADKGKTIALGGNGFYALTFNAASGYDADFMVTVLNEDAGRAKSIALTGGATFYLWPGQSILVFNQNNVWQTLGRGRWKLPASQTVYVNASLGNDANDGLATGTSAMQTVQAALYLVTNNFDFLSNKAVDSIIIIQMQTNDTTGVHFGTHGLVGAVSGGDITLDGGGFSISNAGDTDSALHFFFGTVLYLQNLTIVPGTNHAGLQAEMGAKVFLKAGIVFAASPSGSSGAAHMQIQTAASVEVDVNYSISGSAGFHVFAKDGGSFVTPGAPTISVMTNIAVAIGAIATNGGILDFIGASYNTVTGKRWEADNLGLVVSATGTPNTFFPGNSNGSTSGGGQGV